MEVENKMILHIALCDDDQEAIRSEASLISDIFAQKEIKYSLHIFNSPTALLNTDIIYDIAFLDIEMEEMSGIELARQISYRKRDCLVFFLTNYSVYLDNAFDVNAMRYLTKPIDKLRLISGIDSALERLENRMKVISVTNLRNKIKIDIEISNILYISTSGRHTQIVTTELDFIAEEIFTKIQNMIEKEVNYFAMPHQSYFVNLKCVADYTKDAVIISYATKKYNTLMARRRYKEFDEKMFRMAQGIR